MTNDSVYRQALLDHYRNPRNRADPGDCAVIRRGRNPRCGDDLEIGVDFDGDTVRRVRFRGRGCSICIASASMMTEAASGRSRAEVRELSALVHRWFGDGPVDEQTVPDGLRPLAPVRDLPARRRCVLLAWEAMDAALAATGGQE